MTFGAVARRANVSKSGIVAHFPSMDDLKRAIIDRAMELWSGPVWHLHGERLSGLAELTRYLKVWINWTKRVGLPGACPIALAIFEYTYNGGSGAVRVAVAAAEGRWRQTLVDLIDGAIAKSELPPKRRLVANGLGLGRCLFEPPLVLPFSSRLRCGSEGSTLDGAADRIRAAECGRKSGATLLWYAAASRAAGDAVERSGKA